MATHHPQIQRLASRLLKSCFGDISEAVAKCLMDRGPQTLRELILHTEFAHLASCEVKEKRKEGEGLVRASLQCLIQHAFVLVYLVQPEATRKNSAPEEFHMYSVDVPAIVNLIRAPYYIQHAWLWYGRPDDDSSGQIHQAIIQSLLENGRLTIDQIISSVREKGQESGNAEEAEVKNAFQAMVLDRYIEHATPCDLPQMPAPVFEKLTGRRAAVPKPGSEAAKKVEDEQAKQIPSQQYMENRYKLPPELSSPETGTKRQAEEQEIPSTPAAKKQKTSRIQKVSRTIKKKTPTKENSATTTPQKSGEKSGVKLEQTPSKTIGAAEADNVPQLWQISHSTFKRRFRQNACADILHFKSGLVAGTLANAVLRACKSSMNVFPKDENSSAAVTVQDVERSLEQMADISEDFTQPDDLAQALDEVAKENSEFMVKTQVKGQPAYYFNLKKLIDAAKIKNLQGVIKRRFGVHGVRVWNCLREYEQMEIKTIHERCLLPQNDTREILYKLLRAGFISLQDVPKSADHAPSKTFYLWKIDMKAAYDHLTVNMLKGVCNLQDRLHAELKKRHQLMDAMEKDDKAALRSLVRDVQTVRNIITQLDCQLMSLTPILALYMDF